MYDAFRVRSLEFSLRSFDAPCKISNVKIFKRSLVPQFSSNFNQTLQKACIQGKYRLLLFLDSCQILKGYGTLKISYLSQIASIHKAMLVSSSNRSSKLSRPLGLLLMNYLCLATSGPKWSIFSKLYVSYSDGSFSMKCFIKISRWQIGHKMLAVEFWNFKFEFLKADWNFH